MSIEMNTVRDLVALWPARRDLASDLNGQGFIVTADRVHKWAQSGSIPAKYHQAIVDCGLNRGFPVSADVITRMHHHPDLPNIVASDINSTQFSNQSETSHEQSKDSDAA